MSEILELLELISRLLHAEDVLLLCHKNPDGDTIGSAAALQHALKNLGKNAAVLCADPIPARYGYMQLEPYTGQFTPGYVVAVDIAGIQLFGDALQPYVERVDLCIDHHSSNAGYADAMYLDGGAAATAEIIYELLRAMNAEITPLIADCLYTGLSTDTGCFLYSNTTAHTHTVAAALMEAGARVVMISHQTAAAVDGGQPATLSYRIVTELLRGELGFEGVAVTDALRMDAVAGTYGSGEACVRALLAGCDMLLLPKNFSNGYHGVLEAVTDGRLSEERIDESVRRILKLKDAWGLLK